jgi:hypothetical protein
MSGISSVLSLVFLLASAMAACAQNDAIQKTPGLSSGEMASWVQAIGSILAILVAIYVGQRQAVENLRSQNRSLWHAKELRYDALRGLTESTIEELSGIITALKEPDPARWFEENSAYELMVEFHRAFQQVSPLEMPSSGSARALIRLRDIVGAAAANIKTALEYSVESPIEFGESLAVLQNNLDELRDVQLRLVDDIYKSISMHR